MPRGWHCQDVHDNKNSRSLGISLRTKVKSLGGSPVVLRVFAKCTISVNVTPCRHCATVFCDIVSAAFSVNLVPTYTALLHGYHPKQVSGNTNVRKASNFRAFSFHKRSYTTAPSKAAARTLSVWLLSSTTWRSEACSFTRFDKVRKEFGAIIDPGRMLTFRG